MKRFNRIPEFSSSSELAKVEKIVIFSYRLSFHKIDKRPEQDKKKIVDAVWSYQVLIHMHLGWF